VDLLVADIELIYIDHREFRLKRILDTIKENYDFVLIDCPPSLGQLTVNALTVADGVVLPLQCEYFALEGVPLLLNTIELVYDRFNSRLILLGLLVTMYDAASRAAAQVANQIAKYFYKERLQSIFTRRDSKA